MPRITQPHHSNNFIDTSSCQTSCKILQSHQTRLAFNSLVSSTQQASTSTSTSTSGPSTSTSTSTEPSSTSTSTSTVHKLSALSYIAVAQSKSCGIFHISKMNSWNQWTSNAKCGEISHNRNFVWFWLASCYTCSISTT